MGGPAPTTDPSPFTGADVVFRGEAEGRIEALLEALGGTGRRVLPAPETRPEPGAMALPRYDLLRPELYTSMSIQTSRGCPYTCEFCDIIEIFGRRPRVKGPEQVVAELEALYQWGWRSSVFVVDDNFIGDRKAAGALLSALAGWQKRRGHAFELYTEASVNLAADEALMDGMVAAGFSSVFVGIETPSAEALAGAGKTQNLRMPLDEAVDRITRKGLEVMGGFIVGFDEDDVGTFARQRAFIEGSPIALAMVGLLTALPGTRLSRRLEAEGRLRTAGSGDQFERPNFEPALEEATLLEGYSELMQKLYTVDAYYDRCEAFVARAAHLPGRRPPRWADVMTFVRTSLRTGLRGSSRGRYWRLLWRSLTRAPHTFPWAVAHAVMGEHMIRYTRDDLVPRIAEAVAEVRGQAQAALAAGARRDPLRPWSRPGPAALVAARSTPG